MIKIAFHGQLADLRVQVMDDRLMVALALVGAAGEHLLQAILGLPLPARNPARMHLMLGRDLLDRAVPAQCLHRHPRLELRCKSTPLRRHLVGPPPGQDSTLSTCPVFRDHLTNSIMLTFTETHYFEQNHTQDTDGRTRHKWYGAGTVSRTDTTVTKSYFDDGRSVSVEKDYFLGAEGNALFVHTWGDERQGGGFDRFTRVADAAMTTGLPPSLRGTWQGGGAWYEEEDGTWREDIETLTFTESRFILYGESFNTDNNEIFDTWDSSGGWIDHVSGDSVTRIEHGHDAVVKQYVIAGDLLAINPWGDNESNNGFNVFTRVHDPVADLVGRWSRDYEDDEGRSGNITITIGADGSLQREYSPEILLDEDDVLSHTVTGTYQLDTAEKFIFVTITETVVDGELSNNPFGSPGQILRFAYAPSNNPNQILMSIPWNEQEYDHAQGMTVDHPEHPYGAYWDRLTKVE